MKKTFLITLGLLSFCAGAAQAEVPQGYFGGRKYDDARNTGKVKVFIQAVNYENIPTYYGLILRDSDKTGAIFVIEELEDGTLAWKQRFQTEANVLSAYTSQQYTYSGTVFRKKNGKVKSIELSPTDFGKELGCNESIKVEPSASAKWVALPATGSIDFVGNKGSKVTASNRMLKGSFFLNASSYNSSFVLSPEFPGQSLLREYTIDSEAADGKLLKNEITAVVAILKRTRDTYWGLSSEKYYSLHLIRLRPAEATCASPVTELKED